VAASFSFPHISHDAKCVVPPGLEFRRPWLSVAYNSLPSLPNRQTDRQTDGLVGQASTTALSENRILRLQRRRRPIDSQTIDWTERKIYFPRRRPLVIVTQRGLSHFLAVSIWEPAMKS